MTDRNRLEFCNNSIVELAMNPELVLLSRLKEKEKHHRKIANNFRKLRKQIEDMTN